MKTFYKAELQPTACIFLMILLMLSSSHTNAQSLTEITGIRFYEHHSSTINSGQPFGNGANGSQSGYDFVNQTYYNSFNTANFGAYQNGEEANIDMAEHNGPYGNNSNFGFTSGTSSIWGGDIQGNGTTQWVLASGNFNYNTASTVSELETEYNLGTPNTTINAVQANAIYIAKIRNTNLFVAIRCYNVTNVTNPSGVADVFFDFDYKYGTLVTSNILVTSINIQGQGGATTITSQGGTLQMIETVLPSNATDKSVSWSVSNGSGSATIDANGLLTATGDGTVLVTATANDGSSVTGSTTITISNQSVGITELNGNNVISVYPNPITNSITVKSDIDIESIKLFSVDGRLITNTILLNEKNDISTIKNGLYSVVLISSDGLVYTKKIIKQ